ncbi:MAG: hypothetical protein ACOY5B_18800 [Spirochaetota bacterium]
MKTSDAILFSSTDKYRGKVPEDINYTYPLSNHSGAIDNLIEVIYEGNPVLPYHLRNSYRRNDNWLRTNLLFVDIDDGMTLREALEKFKNSAVLIYTTSSHQMWKKGKKCDRYRIVFLLPAVVENPILILLFNLGTMAFYGHDKEAKPYLTGYQSGLSSQVFRFNPENRLDVIALVNRYLSETPLETAHKEIAELSGRNELGQASLNSVVDVYFEALKHDFPQSYKDYVELRKNTLRLSLEDRSSPKSKKQKRHRNIPHFDFPFFLSVCTLVQNIRFATFDELSHLAKNLLTIERGRKHFLAITKNRPITEDDSFRSYADLLKFYRKLSSRPSTCKNNCKYFGKECQVSPYNITRAQRLKVGQVRRIESDDAAYATLEDARRWLNKSLIAAIQGV